jgi:hypothetical protein
MARHRSGPAGAAGNSTGSADRDLDAERAAFVPGRLYQSRDAERAHRAAP